MGKPTRFAPIPKPAPWRAVTPIEGEKISRTAKTAAAAIVTVRISSRGSDFRGMKTSASATATPSTTYFIRRVRRSFISILSIFVRQIFCWPGDAVYSDSLKLSVYSEIEMSSKNQEPVEDFLSEDPEISSQKIVLLSFLSPEKILAQKDVFFFQKFLADYEMQWKTSKLEAWMAGQLQAINQTIDTIAGKLDRLDLSGSLVKEVRDSTLRVDRFVEDFQEYVRKNLREMKESTLKQEYEDFLFKKSAELEEEFFKLNNFTTTIRGIKVRGVFSSDVEASAKAKKLQRADPNFNIYMGSVGKWMAWEPDPSKVGEQEYANDQLNNLMKKYRENEENRDNFYTEQKARRIGTARTRDSGVTESTKVSSSDATAEADASSSAAPMGGAYEAMFSGPADLAIERKMQKPE